MDEVSEAGEEEGNMDGAKLSVTQFDDPLSGGHFAEGASKAPLGTGSMVREMLKSENQQEKDSPQVRQRT